MYELDETYEREKEIFRTNGIVPAKFYSLPIVVRLEELFSRKTRYDKVSILEAAFCMLISNKKKIDYEELGPDADELMRMYFFSNLFLKGEYKFGQSQKRNNIKADIFNTCKFIQTKSMNLHVECMKKVNPQSMHLQRKQFILDEGEIVAKKHFGTSNSKFLNLSLGILPGLFFFRKAFDKKKKSDATKHKLNMEKMEAIGKKMHTLHKKVSSRVCGHHLWVACKLKNFVNLKIVSILK